MAAHLGGDAEEELQLSKRCRQSITVGTGGDARPPSGDLLLLLLVLGAGGHSRKRGTGLDEPQSNQNCLWLRFSFQGCECRLASAIRAGKLFASHA